MGYRRIGFAGWMEEASADLYAETRCQVYVAWMREHGGFEQSLCATQRSIDRNTEQSGYQLATRLLSQPDPPDVIVTCNDNMAVGAYRAVNELGLAIPADVSIASFNDISVAQFLNPPLTTVRLPAEEIGETAVELLLERIAGRDLSRHVTIANRIIWRGSTRQPAERAVA